MFCVQLLPFQLHSSKSLHTKPILVNSYAFDECQKVLMCFKFKPTIKYTKYNYKSISQLLMVTCLHTSVDK